MSDFDEYDVYDIPPEFHAILFPETAPPLSIPERDQAHSTAQQLPAPTPAPDEFDAYDFSEFSAEDFARIDAVLAAGAAPGDLPLGAAGPRLAIELEGSADCSAVVKDPAGVGRAPRATSGSPYERFRARRQVLSVSDLVGPAWCEVQFDYGLRQKRSRALKDRPKSFVTEKGTLITVDQNVAVTNNTITTRGKSVHKTLERELHPEVVELTPSIPEEYWAVRLLNMLASVGVLLEEGRCREIPVFGIVHDQIVVGIIDELVRTRIPVSEPQSHFEPEQSVEHPHSPNKRSPPSTPSKSKSKKTCRSPSPTQSLLTTFFSNNPQTPKHDQADATVDVNGTSDPVLPSTPRISTVALPENAEPTRVQPGPAFRLHISDTKTRRTPSLPSEPDTLQARLQLMLYHRMLAKLLVSPDAPGSAQPFDFDALWARVGVDPTRPFTPLFTAQAGLLLPGAAPPRASCLRDLAAAWTHAADALAVDGVDDALTVVYRAQPLRTRTRADTREAHDLAAAVQASLNEPPAAYAGGDDALARAIAHSLADVGAPSVSAAPAEGDVSLPPVESGTEDVPGGDPTPHLDATAGEPAAAPRSQSQPRDAAMDTEEEEEESSGGETLSISELDVRARVLGTKVFVRDDALLDGYLASVLQWWHGLRAPRGVDVEATRRCQVCEYRDGCEWRNEKAREAVRAAGRKGARA